MNKQLNFATNLIAFSAPSGAGKTTIVKHLVNKYAQTVISISATTREIRPQEKNGRDYFFLSKEEFESKIKQNSFLEYEEVHGNYYGTLKKTVDNFIEQDKIVLFDIDVNGALAIKEKYKDTMLIFIKPPSQEELVRRLQYRKSETEASIAKRLQRLEFEYKQAEKFDQIVINDDLHKTIEVIESHILK